MTALYIASLNTRHYDFEGVGATEAAAIDAIKRALNCHGAQCALGTSWWRDIMGGDEFPVRLYQANGAYRDGSLLPA